LISGENIGEDLPGSLSVKAVSVKNKPAFEFMVTLWYNNFKEF